MQAVYNQKSRVILFLQTRSPLQRISLLAAAFFAALAAYFYDQSAALASLFSSFSIALLAIALLKPSSPTIPTFSEDLKLTWEDISLMTQQDYSFGLRHVDSIESAEKEKKEGFFGDALNLDFTASRTWEIYKPNDTPDAKGWRALDKLILFGGSEEEREALVKFCEAGIDAFIRGYQTKAKSAYLLINYGQSGHYSYDNHLYGNGLGKAGKQRTESRQVMAIIPPPSRELEGDALYCYFHNAIIWTLKSQTSC